jgi:hypothetical protein
MSISKDNEPVYSKGVLEFLTVANEYCLFTEKAEMYSKEDILHYYVKICPLLYLKGILLPKLEENDAELTERYLTEEAWESVYQTFKKKLGEEDFFWHIENEDADEKTPIKLSISEHVADVYQDMKDFVMLYQKSTQAAKENAVRECSCLFETHWGSIIIRIQKAMHQIIFPEQAADTSEFDKSDLI